MKTGGATPAPAGQPLVAVVTVAYRSNAVLNGFLSSVVKASEQSVFVVVVDNRPDEESRAAEFSRTHGARYVPLPGNPGYGSAVNAGVLVLPPSVRWVLISNPDVVLHPGVIDELEAVGDTDLRIGAVGPAVLNTDGTIYPSARRVPSAIVGIGHALFVNFWPSNPWTRRYRHDSSVESTSRNTGWLSGACLLVRREVFDTIGGFDEGYFMYFEDVDLGYRLNKAGYHNRYEPSATVTHAGGHTAEPDSVQMIQAHHASARRFVERKYSHWFMLPVRIALSTGLTARSALLQRRAR
jgi:N-acetylglucosaminyl-diphospho-decaprenol L-rhamnosyltransferase